jgi:fructose-bisphosphate aldolase class II
VPVATPDQYLEMLDRAKKQGFAYPAINVSSSQTLNAALAGLAAAGSDGILQVTTGGGDYWSGPTIKHMATGAAAMAAFAREVAKNYGITVALHTDHCAKEQLDEFVNPLIEISNERVRAGQDPLFNSHMWDGSAVPMAENLKIAQEMLAKTKSIGAVLEVEIGVVGGEEDGVEAKHGANLYTTPEDGLLTAEALGLGENGQYMVAFTFGNVHGVYKPGNVQLRPSILGDIQQVVGAKYGVDKPFNMVFHGGSGSSASEISEAVSHGVIKMNIDTDTQYAFTRPIAAHMFTNYDGVLKVDGDVGNKKAYDPRAWGKVGEAGMAARIVEAANELGSAGKSMSL